MSDYQPGDGRPDAPLRQCTVGDEVYVFHHGGLIGLEVGPWSADGGPHPPAATVGLSAKQARFVARELLDRADEVDGVKAER